MNRESFYSMLGVTEDASQERIQSAYLEKIQAEVGVERTQALTLAFRTLSDPAARRRYDADRLAMMECGTSAASDVEHPPLPNIPPVLPSTTVAPPSQKAPVAQRIGDWLRLIGGLFLLTLGIKWFGLLFGLLFIPLLFGVWHGTKHSGALVRWSAVVCVFLVTSFIAAFGSYMLKGKLKESIGLSPVASAPASNSPVASGPVSAVPQSPVAATPPLQGYLSQHDMMRTPYAQLDAEQWRLVLTRYWAEKHQDYATPKFADDFNEGLRVAYGVNPEITAGDLLISATRYANQSAKAAYDRASAPASPVVGKPIADSGASYLDRPSRPNPERLTSSSPGFESLSAEEQLSVYEGESQARLQKFYDEQRAAQAKRPTAPVDPAKVIEQGTASPIQ